MPVFKKQSKGIITQKFKNKNDIYNDRGGYHSGVDYYIGHGEPVVCDNDGYVYKTYKVGDLDSNWCGVYMLVPTDSPDVYMEIVQGHFIENKVKAGDEVKAGDVIGLQGNYGFVYGTYKGKFQQVPVEAQLSGETTAGSHVHESWRPIKLVRMKQNGQRYLNDSNGKNYKHNGKYCEVIHNDNGIKGYVNPMDYIYNGSIVEKLKQQVLMKALVSQIIDKLFKNRSK